MMVCAGALGLVLSACGAESGEQTEVDQSSLVAPNEVSPALAASPVYQAYQAYLAQSHTAASSNVVHSLASPAGTAGTDTVESYAARCDVATGIHVPAFNCDLGTEVPNQGTTPDSGSHQPLCNYPNVLNGECDPGSKFQVLVNTPNAVAVAHCRKNGQQVAGSLYNDIAVIQYNKSNGAVCYYQALSSLNGSNVSAPTSGSATFPWISPSGVNGIRCTGCHDNGGFIRSKYLTQLTTPPNVLPSTASGFDNLSSPLRYVGTDFAQDKSWSVTAAQAPGDSGPACTTCHRLSVNNRKAFNLQASGQPNGTAANFANVATAASQLAKNPHSASSPIWMRPGQTTYNANAEASATKFQACARGFWSGQAENFTSGTATGGCSFSPLGAPWLDFSAWQMLPGGSLTSGPAVTASSAQNLTVVARATDSTFYFDRASSSNGGLTWSYGGWLPLGGGFSGAPSASAYGTSLQNTAVVGRALDNNPYISVCVGTSCTFGGWNLIPGLNISNDAAVVYKAPYLYVVSVISAPAGTANVYWTRNDVSAGFNNANWSAWSLIPGGILITAPAATVLDGALYVAGAGTDHHYYLASSGTGASWSGWSQIASGNPTVFTSAPALASWSGGHIEVFGAVSNNGASELWNSVSPNAGATWGALESAGGNMIGGPAAVSPTTGVIQYFVTGTDVPQHHVYQGSNRGQ